MNKPARDQQTHRSRQRGISSVLFMLLSGLSLGAMVFGAIYYVRGLQSQSVTVHALTQAQLKAWSGVEAVRQYLFQLGAAEAAKLSPNQAVSFAGVSGIAATVSDVTAADSTNCGGGTRVGFNITGSSGGANALLAATFCAKGNGGTPGGGSKQPAVNIKGNLDLGGKLDVLGDATTKVVVDGKVTGSGSLSGISNLYATGDITLGGGNNLDVLFSEGSIDLSGSGIYSSVQAMKNVTLSGGVGVGTLTANGTVTLSSNTVTDLTAQGNVTMTSAAKLVNLKSGGNVVGSNVQISGKALVVGNYEEKSNGSVASGNYGGSLISPAWNTQIKMTRQAGLSINYVPLTAGTVSSPKFDAYAYKSIANYVFERVSNDTKVTVNNVNGVTNGTYFLKGDGSGNQDYLCTSSSYSAASCKTKICSGYSAYNSCFSYSGTKWTVAGTTMAPGVVWFKGDLETGTGNYYNSWIATGNINTAGNNITWSVNYAGYANVCTNSTFPSLAPTNFCKVGDTKLQSVPAGNIAFGAGGLVGTVYSGGKIDLSASNDIYGSVLAGDIVTTGGSTVVHGYVSAGRLGNNAGNSSLGASTKIDLRNLPSGFDPGSTDPTVAEAFSATLLWSRYR
ncbi:hypothetical protein WG899_01025 [Paucibacter sp. AS339]|uniref:hypothetical protein n=1 Tax=Paucibacter hankyongi TaxID=3133434 RepID=UPI0030A4E075